MLGSFLCVLALAAMMLPSALANERASPESQPTIATASKPQQTSSWANQKVLFVYAHIDDMEMSSGGLVTVLHQVHAEPYFLIMTNSNKGCANAEICANLTNDEVATLRKQEQLDSAAILGIPAERFTYFDEYDDMMLKTYPTADVLRRVVEHIRTLQPSVVFSWDMRPALDLLPHDGWGDLGYHPDHQISGQLTMDAVWGASLDRMWPEVGGGAWKISELYLWTHSAATVQPTHYLNITDAALLGPKGAAFAAMKSQFAPGKTVDQVTAAIATVGARVAHSVGLHAGDVAEAYNYVLW